MSNDFFCHISEIPFSFIDSCVVVKPSSFTYDSINSKAALKKFISKHGHPHPGKEWLKDRFWSDGMVRVTGREYNGLLDTACIQKGKMSCLSCH